MATLASHRRGNLNLGFTSRANVPIGLKQLLAHWTSYKTVVIVTLFETCHCFSRNKKQRKPKIKKILEIKFEPKNKNNASSNGGSFWFSNRTAEEAFFQIFLFGKSCFVFIFNCCSIDILGNCCDLKRPFLFLFSNRCDIRLLVSFIEEEFTKGEACD